MVFERNHNENQSLHIHLLKHQFITPEFKGK